MNRWRCILVIVGLAMFLIIPKGQTQMKPSISESTLACLACHATLHPGIVTDWKKSRHAKITPSEALKKNKLERRISNEKVPDLLLRTVVGCAECHTLNSEKHKDSFEHNGFNVHIIVTPSDCSTCHPVEAQQYGKNLMSHAYGNLVNNPLYGSLAHEVNGLKSLEGKKITTQPPDVETNLDSCLHCHGTEVRVKEKKPKKTSMGEMEFPVLSGWPNQGVSRVNPDGSKGTCTACHTRHQFSIEMARKPHTCSQCHKGPDVPAYPVL